MKKQAKLFVAFLCVLIALVAFSMLASATEYTVSSNDEFNTAFASAVDGDTIVIKGDISTSLSFRKSITYILEANWVSNGATAPDANGGDKNVSIFAKAGNYTFALKGEHWCNDYSNNPFNSMCLTWSFGGVENGVLTVDLQDCYNRIFHQNSSNNYNIIYNLYNGTKVVKIGHLKNNKNNNSRFFIGKEFNMYEGSYFVGNKATEWTPFIDVTTLNMYGGEIAYNCGDAGNGAIQADNLNMYGGKIHNNYQAWNNNVVTGFMNVGTLKMYGGEICNNYSVYKSANTVVIGEQGTSRGSFYFKDDSVIYDNYVVDSMTILKNENTGLYYLESVPTPREDSIVHKYRTIHNFDYSLIFKNANGSVINAYMVKEDGSILMSFDGSEIITVPGNVSAWTTKANYCKQVIPSVDSQGTYYVAISHEYTNSTDCTKATACEVCQEIIRPAIAENHKLVTTITYEKYSENGDKIVKCENDTCSYCEKTDAKALIVFMGYSKNREGTEMCVGYDINYEAIAEYKTLNGIFEYGMTVAIASNVADSKPLVVKDNKVETASPLSDGKIIKAEITSDSYTHVQFRLTGDFSKYQNTEILMSAYVYDGTNIYYIQTEQGNSVIAQTIAGVPQA